MNLGGREKIIKDNVHGYIHISREYFDIIDTALFQRLKNVKQTSYISLYPSSTHDRFIHSLGTYYLGRQVIEALWNNVGDEFDKLFSQEEKDTITFTFELACLLHDVGHAPFSHTGENFYKIKGIDKTLEFYDFYTEYKEGNRISNFSYLDGLLLEELNKFYPGAEGFATDPTMKTFLSDYSNVLRDDSAKPHEKMSALLSLSKLILEIESIVNKINEKSEDKVSFNADLFVRCITGTKYATPYRDKENKQRFSFYTAIVTLLNSDIIDVDKLDYILRDNFMTGYENISIDTERLIKSFTVVKVNDYCLLAYKKNALSVIENVIRANDSTRRWVQSHPVILYDTYITQRCVSETFKVLKKEKEDRHVFENFFCIDALTLEGKDWAEGEHVFLASDLDVISLMKRAYYRSEDSEQQEIFREFFSRNRRRHPLWKSEAEYKVCFPEKMESEREIVFRKIKDGIAVIETFIDDSTGVGRYIFTEDTFEKVKDEMGSAGRIFLGAVKQYFDQLGKPMDIAILTARSFASKIKKLNTNSLQVVMPAHLSDRTLYEYSKLLHVEDSSSDKVIFYLYSHHRIEAKDFIDFLFEKAKFE